jgi:uncharacterized protein (DUF1786 family)
MRIIRDSLSDVLGIEQHALQRIERQIQDERLKRFSIANGMLQKIEGVLNEHIALLERHLSAMNGGVEARLKKTATSIAGSMASVYDRFRTSEPVSRMLRDDYSILNFAVISYGMLHTTALILIEGEIAVMAQSHMADLTPLIVELSDIIPFVLEGELAVERKAEVGAVAAQAVAHYRQAWSREVTARM